MREGTVVERDCNKQSAALSQTPFLKCEIGKHSVFTYYFTGEETVSRELAVAQPVKEKREYDQGASLL